MLTDLVLAIAHHVLIFALAAVLTAEMMLVRPGMGAAEAAKVARIDFGFGVLAGLILIVGFARVYFGLKGADLYWHNLFFHAKLAAFLLVGILSIWPTLRFIKWRAAIGRAQDFVPPLAEVEIARRFIHLELVVFILIPVFAALMARGYGSF
jgi:putative membrane protein